MPLPQKRWFRLADVATRWNMPLSDIEDYALDEMLQLSVFVVDVPIEANGAGGGEDRLIHGMPLLNGPQPLQRTSLLEIFREGQAEVRAFRGERPNKHLYVWSGAPAVIVRREDLILTREERDRFEREHAVATGEPSSVWHNDDFTRVRVANEWHSFGPKQAAVLRLLKAASDGGNPWLDGKRLLEEADAATMRLTGEQMLQHVAGIIAERSVTYGDAATSMATVAQRWSITLGHPVTPAQVVLCLIDLKLTRLQHNPKHQDSMWDLAGYAAVLQEVNR